MLAIPENDIVKIVRLHDGYHSVFGSSSQVPLPVSVPLLFRFMTHWLRGSSPLYLSASASARSRSLPRPRLDLGLRSTVSCFASLPRKEVIQPHLPIRLPCYDFTPVISLTFGSWPRFRLPQCSQLPWCDGRCVQGPGTYSPRHSDPRLLATPTSCGRVAAHNPN